MIHVTTIQELRGHLDAARSSGQSVGLVLTMGYLHAGHGSLIERAAQDCDLVVTTRFVNPLQFAPTDDLAAYPRDLERDSQVAAGAGSHLLFSPSVDEMYPRPMSTVVSVNGVSSAMEGASRPGHFDGVATVVAKFFAIVGACRAYFGEKDYQQLAVIRTMAEDLAFPVDVIGCPTRREPDGLAMSSRNVYLTDAERAAAVIVNRALRTGAALIAGGITDAPAIAEQLRGMIDAEPLATLDYVEIVDATTLLPVQHADASVRLFAAARFGSARLIDNIGVDHGIEVTQ